MIRKFLTTHVPKVLCLLVMLSGIATGAWAQTDAVANVSDGTTTTPYSEFSEALEAWTEGTTLTLLKDVETASTISAPNGNHVLDLNSHVLKGTGSEMSVISIFEGADLTINGPGKITGGTGDRTGGGYKRGGAISVGSIAVPELGGTVTINNCEISENAADFGAGIYTYGGNTTLNNVLITKNSTLIYMDGGTLTVIDSKITGNNGATFLCRNALIRVKGKTIIYDNETNGKQNNLYLHHNSSEESYIEVIGELDADAKIGINKAGAPIVLSQGSTDYNDVSKFVSDNENYIVRKTAEGQLKLGVPSVASVTADGTTTEYETLAETLEAWVSGTTLHLLKDVETASTINVPTGDHTFDLNGCVLKMTGSSGSIFHVGAGVNLVMCDNAEDKPVHYYTPNESGPATISETETEYSFTGGYITGAIGESNNGGQSYGGRYVGGGVNVVGGTFTMNGGTIFGNGKYEAWYTGGAVQVTGDGESTGVFTMNGGALIGNAAQFGSAIELIGFEPYAHGPGECTINGGEIKHNAALYGTIRMCQDAYVTVLNINGGSITNNVGGGGAAVLADLSLPGDAFTMSGNPVIKDNYNGDVPSNIYLSSGQITITGALDESAIVGMTMKTPGVFTNSENIELNDLSKFFSDSEDYAVKKTAEGQLTLGVPPVATVTADGTTTEYDTFASALEAWVDGSTLTLLKDVDNTATITVDNNRTLDLNGRGLNHIGDYMAIMVDGGGNLTLKDSNPETVHYFSVADGFATNINDESGEKSFTGGYITGGKTRNYDSSIYTAEGGAIWLKKGDCTMEGGTLIGNASNAQAVGVYSGTFTMNGGKISYNNNGFHLRSGSDRYPFPGTSGGTVANLVINGGEISYNKSGGVVSGYWCYGGCNLTLTGGSIIHNGTRAVYAKNTVINGNPVIKDNGGGGLQLYEQLSISGAPVITDNTSYNLYVGNNQTFSVVGALEEGANIGVTMATPGVFTNSENTDFNDASKFYSEDANYSVLKTAEGQLKLGVPPVAAVTADGTTTEYETLAEALEAWVDGSTLTLLKDVETASTIEVLNGDYTLDLNGYGILMTGGVTVLKVGDASDPKTTLTMIDSDAERVHYVTLEEYHAISVSDDGTESVTNGTGTVKINGGYIAGGQTGLYCVGNRPNENDDYIAGAGICVGRATFTMKAGTIIGNTIDSSGGAIHVDGTDSHVVMDGGRICYNYADGAAGAVNIGINGYVKYTAGIGKFTMNGGVLDNNCAGAGGAIRINNGELHLNGGSIINNTANNSSYSGGIYYDLTGAGEGDKNYLYISGNAVLKDNYNEVGISNLYLTNGACVTIEGEMGDDASISVSMQTPGVFTNSENVELNDLSKFVSDNEDYVVKKTAEGQLKLALAPVATITADGVTTEYETLAEALEAWVDGSTLTLLKDVETSNTINIPNGTYTLDLNGCGIKKNDGGTVIMINNGGNLTLQDSDPTTTHYFTNENGIAKNINNSEGSNSFKGGYITGGTGTGIDGLFWSDGGGIWIRKGNCTMTGGNIIGNTAAFGGGVEVYSGTFTMSGGRVCYCAGGVYQRSGSSQYYIEESSTVANVVITGGEISDNTKHGIGADYCYGQCNLTISGGSILRNKEWGAVSKNMIISGSPIISQNGNGVSFNILDISGLPIIAKNTNRNLWISNEKTISIAGALGETASIGVSMQTPSVFTNSADTALNDLSKFFSDNEDYSIRKTDEGQLELYTLTVARVTVDGVPTEYTSLAEALEAWVDGSTLTLLKDVETASSIEVTSGTRTLDLNGYGIKMTGSGSVIIVDQEADLTMNDSRPDYTNDSSRRPLDLTDEKVKGGYITGGTGHTVSTNQIKGGGVYTVGSFTMNGGTIIDCHITTDINNNHGGGGVYVGILESGVFNMNGGAIVKCSVETPNGSAWGGGLCVDATFNMTGGRIEGNSTTGINATGAGVWGRDNNSLSGASVIMNNMANGAQSNYMVSGNDANIPTISGLTEGANIGIDTYTSPNNTTDVRFGKLCDKNSIQYLHSDRSSTAGIVYCDGTTDWIYHNGKIQEFTDAHHSHEAESYYLTVEARTYTVSYDSNGATSGAAPTDNLSYFYGEIVTILGSADIAKTGYSFAGWNTEDDGSGFSYAEGDEYEAVADLTLYAQWEIDKYTLTVSANNDELGSVEVNTAGIIDNQDGTYTVEYDTEVTIKATAVEGYHLDSWSNGAEVNEAGTIAVVVVSDTSIVANFAVDKIAITPTVAIEGWKYGDTPKQPTVTGNDGDGEVTYVYARKGSDDFSEEVPTEAGDYVVKVLIGQTDDYAAGEATAEFTIGKADNKTATIVLEGWKYGETPKKPTVTGNGGNGTVTYLYAAKGSDEFSETAPTTAGDYVVKAIIDETANFEATTVTAEFTIEKAIVTVSGVEVATTKLFDNTTEAEVIKQGTLTNLQGSDVLEYTVTAAYNDATPGSGKTITLTYTIIGPKSLMGNYSLASTTVVYSTDGYIAEPIVVDTEHQASGANTVMLNGFEISIFGYCSGGDYSLQYHLGSGDPDQYKVEFENSRFTDIDWTNLTTAGADGTIEIDIPANLPTGDYSMKVTFRNSHYVAIESDPIEVSFHVNLPETYTRPLFDNVIAVVDTCNCLTDIQWYHRDNSNADWEAISGATGYYYRQVGGLTGEYFISTKMNGVSNYTCPQTDMKTLYGAPASVATVHVSPNPVVNNAQITIEGSESFEHELRIVNIMGNEVEVRTFNGSNTTIDMGTYPMGNYMICVDGMVVKVIKK